MAGAPCRLGQLAPPVGRVVAFPEDLEGGTQLGVTDGPGRRGPGLGVVVGGGGDLQGLADRLDPPSTPIGHVVPMGVDEGNYFFARRSSSAQKVAAAWRMSLERRSSKFSLRRRLGSACSSLVSPGRLPASTSARFTQARRDSSPMPSWRATREITVLSWGVLFAQLVHHPDRPLLQFRRVALRGRLLLHDSILAPRYGVSRIPRPIQFSQLVDPYLGKGNSDYMATNTPVQGESTNDITIMGSLATAQSMANALTGSGLFVSVTVKL